MENDRSIDQKLEERLSMHQEALQGSSLSLGGFIDRDFLQKIKAIYIRKLETMENVLTRNLEDFVRFIESHIDTVSDLTRFDIERYGNVTRNSDNFKLRLNDEWRLRLKDYLIEILSGDFNHKNELLRYASLYRDELTHFLKEKIPPQQFLVVLEGYWIYKNLPNGRKPFAKIQIPNYLQGGVIVADADKIEELGKISKLYFEALLDEIIKYSVPVKVDLEFLNDNRIFARFHTHPLNDTNYFPSNQDVANTYIAGPNILFSQHDGILRAYSISRGKSEEIFKADLKSQIK